MSSDARRAVARLGASASSSAVVDLGDRPEPLDVADEASEQHRDALGRERMHAAEQPRQIRVHPGVVERVAELVEHRPGPVLGRTVVAEHAHVAFVVDVDAERVLALPVAGEQVAAFEHAAHVETEPVVGPQREGVEIVRARTSGSRSTDPAAGGSWKNGSS